MDKVLTTCPEKDDRVRLRKLFRLSIWLAGITQPICLAYSLWAHQWVSAARTVGVAAIWLCWLRLHQSDERARVRRGEPPLL